MATELLTASAGGYPRIGDGEDLQALRKGWRSWEKGELSETGLGAIQERFIQLALQEQQKAGIDVLTDGHIRWYDPISHFARCFKGVEIAGLLRFYDTNTYFRQPVVVDKVSWHTQVGVHDYRSCREFTDSPVKPVITGPYTLARHSRIRSGPYRDAQELTIAYANALAQAVTDLASIGASLIQIDEPEILRHPEDLPLLAESLDIMGKHRMNCDLQLSTYFGDATPVFERLLELPVTFVGVDFSYSPGLADHIAAHGATKPLALGLVDARSTRTEQTDDVVGILQRIMPKIDADLAVLAPSTGLDYLPRDRAFKKLQRVREIADRYEEVAA